MADPRRPNLLFIFADQLQAFCLGHMGDTAARTPNLDALAADGVVFRNAYSDSPVCTPYRGCLMTGRYPTQTGVRGNEDGPRADERCLAERIGRRGLTTSYVGKWHLYATGNVPVLPQQRCGFQRFIGYQAYNDFLNDVTFFDEEGRARTFERHRTDATTDLAIERLREIRDRRWLQMVSYQNPHYPLQPSPEFEALFANTAIPRRANVREPERVFTPTFSPFSPRPMERDPNYHRYGKNLDAFLRCYYAMVAQLDWHVGRLIAELKRMGLYDETAIVFTSDHGEMAGSHGLMNKGAAWEESSRVPLIVRLPDGLRGHTVETPVSAGVDLYATLLELAGCGADPRAAGKSIAALARDPEARTHRPIFAEYGDWVFVRDGDRKLVAAREDLRPRQFFDLRSDPYELNDLVLAPELAGERERLSGLLADWRRSMGVEVGGGLQLAKAVEL